MPTEGTVTVADQQISSLTPAERALYRATHVGFVFQLFHLLPYLDILENVLVAARPTHEQEDAAMAGQLLEDFGLNERLGHLPSQLSAGERQRVAMARALAIRPRLLLMDEPFSALDTQVRHSLRDSVRELQRKAGVAAIMVTHDRGEAWALADRIAVMDHGRIVQFDQPEVLSERPANDAVRSLVAGLE